MRGAWSRDGCSCVDRSVFMWDAMDGLWQYLYWPGTRMYDGLAIWPPPRGRLHESD